jgi:hypothetical protein
MREMAVKTYPGWVDDYGAPDWANGANVYYVMLIKTGTYNAAHLTVTDAGFAELTVGGYSKQNTSARTSIVSGANVNLDAADVAFGNLAAGETIIAAVVVRQIGGAPAGIDRLAGFYDGGTTPNELPFATNGGPFDVVWPASGAFQGQT